MIRAHHIFSDVRYRYAISQFYIFSSRHCASRMQVVTVIYVLLVAPDSIISSVNGAVLFFGFLLVRYF